MRGWAETTKEEDVAKQMIGAYADQELLDRIERECALDFNRPKSHMMLKLMTEALDARDAKRRSDRVKILTENKA